MTVRERLQPLIEAANPSREKRDLIQAIAAELDQIEKRLDQMAARIPMTAVPLSEFRDTWSREEKGP
jgi:hypothetical protein